MFSNRVATPFYFYVMAIFRRGTGAPNAGRVGKNRDSRPISDFGIGHCSTVACRQHFDGGVHIYIYVVRLPRSTKAAAPPPPRISESCL